VDPFKESATAMHVLYQQNPDGYISLKPEFFSVKAMIQNSKNPFYAKLILGALSSKKKGGAMKNKNLVKTNGSLFPAIPSLLDNFFGRDWLDAAMDDWRKSSSSLPAVNVQENDHDFMIEVAAPGMKRDDFKIELDNDVLSISSQKEDSHEEKEGNYTRREFSCQSFQRSFSLPQDSVKGDEIKAKYADGILRITVPKAENASTKKPAKQITVA
jgi:HSP20 family protein